MPQTPEFATWAAGPGSQEPAECTDRVDCMLGTTLVAVVAWVEVVCALALGQSPHSRVLVLAALDLPVWIFFLVCSFGQFSQFSRMRQWRVVADEKGLRVFGLFNRRTIPWEEVTDYFFSRPLLLKGMWPFMPPAMVPRPSDWTAVIVTLQGAIRLEPGIIGRENVARAVRIRATSAGNKVWGWPDFEVSRGTREFRFKPPGARQQFHLLCGNLAPWGIFFAPLWGCVINAFLARDMSTRGVFIGFASFFSGLAIIRGAWFVLGLARTVRQHRTDIITVTPMELIWENAGQRVAMKWNEIVGLRPVPDSRGSWLGRWHVRTSQSTIQFLTGLLQDADGLPGLIYERAPQLYMKAETVTGPVHLGLQPGKSG